MSEDQTQAAVHANADENERKIVALADEIERLKREKVGRAAEPAAEEKAQQPDPNPADQPDPNPAEQPEPRKPSRISVEVIVKRSTLEDALPGWIKKTGEEPKDGEVFTFDNVAEFGNDRGVIKVVANGSVYFYNMADLYRVKATPIYD